MMIFCTCFVAWNVQRYYNFTGHWLICFTCFLRYICVVITQASIQEVRARADIVDVLGQFIRLKKRGANYIANCPFHNEKTPSFNVVEDKGFYHCFGCGAHGTAIDFVMAVEGLTFGDALDMHLGSNKKRSARTLGDYRYLSDQYLADWIKKPLVEITRKDCRERHQKIGSGIGARHVSLLHRQHIADRRSSERRFHRLDETHEFDRLAAADIDHTEGRLW